MAVEGVPTNLARSDLHPVQQPHFGEKAFESVRDLYDFLVLVLSAQDCQHLFMASPEQGSLGPLAPKTRGRRC